MQIQQIQDNNCDVIFREKLKFDKKLVLRATVNEKSELAQLKLLFKKEGSRDEIKVKNDRKLTVKDIIDNLRFKLAQIQSRNEAENAVLNGSGKWQHWWI